MEHDTHLQEDVDRAGPGAKIIAVIVIIAALAGIGVYMVYGSGLWKVPQQQSSL